MKRKLIILLTAILLLALTVGVLRLAQGDVLAQSGGDYDVEWSVMGSAGGQFVSGGDYQMGFTLAQDTPPLVSAGGVYQVVQGYWASSEPDGGEWLEFQSYLPIILRRVNIQEVLSPSFIRREVLDESGQYRPVSEGSGRHPALGCPSSPSR